MPKGKLVVIAGPMASGKSGELIRRVTRAKIAKQRVIVFGPETDTRATRGNICSRDSRSCEAIQVASSSCIIEELDSILGQIQLVAVDEAHFFDTELSKIVMRLIDRGQEVIASGLDMDFLGEPFEVVMQLMARADRVLKLSAVCVVCHGEAVLSQRLIGGRPALRSSPRILVGDVKNGMEERYEPRCRNCHEIVD